MSERPFQISFGNGSTPVQLTTKEAWGLYDLLTTAYARGDGGLDYNADAMIRGALRHALSRTEDSSRS